MNATAGWAILRGGKALGTQPIRNQNVREREPRIVEKKKTSELMLLFCAHNFYSAARFFHWAAQNEKRHKTHTSLTGDHGAVETFAFHTREVYDSN